MSKEKTVEDLLELFYMITEEDKTISDIEIKICSMVARSRLDRNMNFEQFANLLNVKVESIINIENGDFNFPATEMLDVIGKIYYLNDKR